MKQYTPVLFFITAALFTLNGAIGTLSGNAERSVAGFAMGFLWLIFGISIKRKQKTNRA